MYKYYRAPWPPRLSRDKELRCTIDLSVSSDHAQAMIASWSVYMLVAILPAPFRCLWFLDARHWRRLGGLETGAQALACVLFLLCWLLALQMTRMAASWNLFVCASYNQSNSIQSYIAASAKIVQNQGGLYRHVAGPVLCSPPV